MLRALRHEPESLRAHVAGLYRRVPDHQQAFGNRSNGFAGVLQGKRHLRGKVLELASQAGCHLFRRATVLVESLFQHIDALALVHLLEERRSLSLGHAHCARKVINVDAKLLKLPSLQHAGFDGSLEDVRQLVEIDSNRSAGISHHAQQAWNLLR